VLSLHFGHPLIQEELRVGVATQTVLALGHELVQQLQIGRLASIGNCDARGCRACLGSEQETLLGLVALELGACIRQQLGCLALIQVGLCLRYKVLNCLYTSVQRTNAVRSSFCGLKLRFNVFVCLFVFVQRRKGTQMNKRRNGAK